ncbi:hypothetical protein HK102_004923 [Quaeritorhiza haematococci]|nr:hypothetical protein HK102_004923 [Quaeritorhiza haematococci]
MIFMRCGSDKTAAPTTEVVASVDDRDRSPKYFKQYVLNAAAALKARSVPHQQQSPSRGVGDNTMARGRTVMEKVTGLFSFTPGSAPASVGAEVAAQPAFASTGFRAQDIKEELTHLKFSCVVLDWMYEFMREDGLKALLQLLQVIQLRSRQKKRHAVIEVLILEILRKIVDGDGTRNASRQLADLSLLPTFVHIVHHGHVQAKTIAIEFLLLFHHGVEGGPANVIDAFRQFHQNELSRRRENRHQQQQTHSGGAAGGGVGYSNSNMGASTSAAPSTAAAGGALAFAKAAKATMKGMKGLAGTLKEGLVGSGGSGPRTPTKTSGSQINIRQNQNQQHDPPKQSAHGATGRYSFLPGTSGTQLESNPSWDACSANSDRNSIQNVLGLGLGGTTGGIDPAQDLRIFQSFVACISEAVSSRGIMGSKVGAKKKKLFTPSAFVPPTLSTSVNGGVTDSDETNLRDSNNFILKGFMLIHSMIDAPRRPQQRMHVRNMFMLCGFGAVCKTIKDNWARGEFKDIFAQIETIEENYRADVESFLSHLRQGAVGYGGRNGRWGDEDEYEEEEEDQEEPLDDPTDFTDPHRLVDALLIAYRPIGQNHDNTSLSRRGSFESITAANFGRSGRNGDDEAFESAEEEGRQYVVSILQHLLVPGAVADIRLR